MFAKVKERIDTGVKAAGAAVGSGATAAADRPVPSIIGPDMSITGNLDTPGEVHVEGLVDGDVTCSRLIIGASGRIIGRVSAVSVRVHGSVQGSVDADEVYLLNGSSVEGDVIQASLEIAPGARFEGAVRRRRPGERQPLPPRVVPEPPVVVAVERLETKAEAPAVTGVPDAGTAADDDTAADSSPASAAPADAADEPVETVEAEVVDPAAKSAREKKRAGG
ncbi:bactofilin family protein [Oleisolibacter albus]|uniref:bactofilin family protein n=1 Tax=Oleisolibacter albus TaxID=2171757 RepID=UPI0013901D6D|nr:polymer-forming cytoskeletal protein [Oleisolibacter albus]